MTEVGITKCFSGSKWDADGTVVAQPFVRRAAQLFGVSELRLEPVTLTRYKNGQYQRQHLDARPKLGDASGRALFEASGGQRLAQVIVYLQAPDAGGETKFHGSAFEGGELAVTPTAGDALVFPTACAHSGEPDERYVHSGASVRGSTPKWIVGTWLTQHERPAGATPHSSERGRRSAPSYDYSFEKVEKGGRAPAAAV